MPDVHPPAHPASSQRELRDGFDRLKVNWRLTHIGDEHAGLGCEQKRSSPSTKILELRGTRHLAKGDVRRVFWCVKVMQRRGHRRS